MSEANITLGSFKIKMMDKIGQGSFGVVYRGNHIKKGFQIAAKQCDLRNEKSGCDAMIEIKHFQHLQDHPHIVKLHDFFYKDRAFWMIMEFCDEGDLQHYFKKSKPLKPLLNEQLNIMFQTASAIAFMHNQKNMVVHRDIKPGNILLKHSRTNIIVKVTDFGLSTVIEAPDPAKSLIMSTTAGAPGFMAPEFFLESKYDQSVDVFSLGLVFLAMISFKPGQEYLAPPMIGPGLLVLPIGAQLVNMKTYGAPIPDLVPVTGEESPILISLKDVIRKMTQFEPKQRCSMSEVEDMISTIGGSTPYKLPGSLEPEADPTDTHTSKSKETVEPTASSRPVPQFVDGSITANNYGDASSHVIDASDAREATQGGGSASSDVDVMMSKNTIGRKSDSDSDSDSDCGIGYKMMKRALDQALKDRLDIDDDVLEGMRDLPFKELLAQCIKPDPAVDGFESGEKVIILDDEDRVEELQDGYGGWHRHMAKYIGKAGIVRGKVRHMIKVTHDDGLSIHYNPKALVKTGEKPHGDDEGPLKIFADEESVNVIKARFKRYEVVTIPEDHELVKCLQDNHGGWKDKMKKSLGVKGMVNRVDGDGDVFVEFINGDDWTLNPELLIKVDMSGKEVEPGDFVVVGADKSIAKRLQKYLGVWEDGMDVRLGHTGVVRTVGKKTITVDSGRRSHKWHPETLTLIAKGEEMMAAILKKNMNL